MVRIIDYVNQLGLNLGIIEIILKIMTILVVLFMTFFTARLLKKFLETYISKSAKRMKTDPKQYNFVKHFIIGIVYIVGCSIAIYMIPGMKSFAVSIFAGAGIFAIVIGFASQQTFSNIISGIFITIFKPYRIGDRISLQETKMGTVEDITLRHTVIRNFENKRIIIPNSVISTEIIENSHIGDEKICKFVDFGISYDSDIDKALRIMREEAMKHPNYIDNRTDEEKRAGDPEVGTRVIGFGDSSINLRAWVWAENPRKAFILGTDLNKKIKERFDKEGIEIPFPYRTVVYKKDIKKKLRKSKK